MKFARFHYNGEDRLGIAQNDSEIIDIRVALGTDAEIQTTCRSHMWLLVFVETRYLVQSWFMHILVVEDEPRMADVRAQGLTEESHHKNPRRKIGLDASSLLLFLISICLNGCVPAHTTELRPMVSESIDSRVGIGLRPEGFDDGLLIAEGIRIDDGITESDAAAIALWNNADFQTDLTGVVLRTGRSGIALRCAHAHACTGADASSRNLEPRP